MSCHFETQNVKTLLKVKNFLTCCTDRHKSFDAASVTANTGTTVAIVLSITAMTCLCYFCYYKRLCNHCCRGKTRSSTLDTKIPDFNQESGNMHWFKEQDQPEPDTISFRTGSCQVSVQYGLQHTAVQCPCWQHFLQVLHMLTPLATVLYQTRK